MYALYNIIKVHLNARENYVCLVRWQLIDFIARSYGLPLSWLPSLLQENPHFKLFRCGEDRTC